MLGGDEGEGEKGKALEGWGGRKKAILRGVGVDVGGGGNTEGKRGNEGRGDSG